MTDWVERALASMTVQEKLVLVSGAGLFHTQEIKRLGIRSLHMADGSQWAQGGSWCRWIVGR